MGRWRWIANFTPQKSAANTRTATVVAQTRRQYGKMTLLRRNRQLRRERGRLALHLAEMAAAAIHAVSFAGEGIKVFDFKAARIPKSAFLLTKLLDYFTSILRFNVEHLFKHLFRF
jgi:hypothetical protein